LANVAEHAHATHVDIDLFMDTERPGLPFIQLRVADDGIGFDPTNPDASGRDGLRVLEHRLVELGGSLTVQARPGNGTTVRIELPDTGEHRA